MNKHIEDLRQHETEVWGVRWFSKEWEEDKAFLSHQAIHLSFKSLPSIVGKKTANMLSQRIKCLFFVMWLSM